MLLDQVGFSAQALRLALLHFEEFDVNEDSRTRE